MTRTRLIHITLLFITLLSTACADQNPAVNTLFEDIQNRLSLMKEVAAYKWETDSPIEVKERETIVLKATLQAAEDNGVDPSTAKSFFEEQIEVAKSIQRAWHKHWEENSFDDAFEGRDIAKIRVEISTLGKAIIVAMPQALPSLHNAANEAHYRQIFFQTIDTDYVTDDDKERLFSSLVNIQLKHSAKDEL
ncbi:MAG: hypothetical protein Tsb0018_10350 [Opitutales bacterium]|tara:strand:+ start:112 stop:687 length:576 start_codon:yes stop_codon:yes gene_type:complete